MSLLEYLETKVDCRSFMWLRKFCKKTWAGIWKFLELDLKNSQGNRRAFLNTSSAAEHFKSSLRLHRIPSKTAGRASIHFSAARHFIAFFNCRCLPLSVTIDSGTP
ncbi:hypothetical protein TNCV_1080211 [Trichonephila clavipes]|nr:hypothetical protein TNCV_1080211 [Trichonephila clavipes]